MTNISDETENADEAIKLGRPPHEPDEKTKKLVSAMSSYGVPQEDIAKVLEIDPKTLRKYYSYELDTAGIKANTKVAEMLYNKCMKGETASIIFWLKTKAGWKEKVVNEHAGADGAPLNPYPTEISVVLVKPDEYD